MSGKFPEIYAALRTPFPYEAHYFRFVKAGNNRFVPLTYCDARAYQERLDEVFGPEGWSVAYFPGNQGVICSITVRWPDGTLSTKSDGAGETQVEGEKGQHSDAFKRACAALGVGRYLYALKFEAVMAADQYEAAKQRPKLLKMLQHKLAKLNNTSSIESNDEVILDEEEKPEPPKASARRAEKKEPTKTDVAAMTMRNWLLSFEALTKLEDALDHLQTVDDATAEAVRNAPEAWRERFLARVREHVDALDEPDFDANTLEECYDAFVRHITQVD